MTGRPGKMLRFRLGIAGFLRATASRLALILSGAALSDIALASDTLLPVAATFGVFGARVDPLGPAGIVMLGLSAFSLSIAMLHLRTRRLWNEADEVQRARIAELEAHNERLEIFLAAEPQLLVNWDGRNGEAIVEGDSRILGPGVTTKNVTRFSDWLNAYDVSRLRALVDRLRENGEGFDITLTALSGALIEMHGRPISGRAIMHLKAITGEKLERERLSGKLERLAELIGALKDMLNAIPQPVWLRDANGNLSWVNDAYVRAVEARDTDDVVARKVALLESATLEKIEDARKAHKPFRQEVQAVVSGHRRVLDIVEVLSSSKRSGGIATDVTDLEDARRDVEQQNTAHVRTLDQLPTAVVLFDQNQQMAFYNKAFNELWQFDRAFLDMRPSDSEMLDRLRADGKLPEHADFREWKLGLQQSLNANETLEDVWLLPNGRSLRVVVSPSTAGAVSYLFDDITEQMHLAQNYNRLASMQGETLDSLTEGVAVFGSHGRLQLHNPAFATLWGLSREVLSHAPHIDDIIRLSPPEALPAWRDIHSTVCGLPDERITRTFEARMDNGQVLALVVTPLPEGASLLTVEDVTSTVNAARMLKERNDALESASRSLKEKNDALNDMNAALQSSAQFRSDFIHNVSFELRLPLTSVIGISQMLAAGTVGPLNDRQRAYTTDLIRSTDSVLALLNDILALTSIESTGLELSYEAIELRRTISEATEGLKDRLGGAGVGLSIDIAADTGRIHGDAKRIRQIMFNLIANAVASSDPGDTVTLSARHRGGNVEIRIADRGTFDPATMQSDERKRAETGQGLRLSIIHSLVELHGGQLTISMRNDGMREVCCALPSIPSQGAAHAS